MREDGDVVAERGCSELGVVARDDAGLLERANPAQAGWRRDAGAAGELDVGHAAVVLQVAQDPPVDLVELDALASLFSPKLREARNYIPIHGHRIATNLAPAKPVSTARRRT
jgi:hypothetical protein